MQSTVIFHTANVLSILSESLLFFHFANNILPCKRKKCYVIILFILVPAGHFFINHLNIKYEHWLFEAFLAIIIDSIFVFALFSDAIFNKLRLIAIYYMAITLIEFSIISAAYIYMQRYSVDSAQLNSTVTLVITVIIRVAQWVIIIAFLCLMKRDFTSKIILGFVISPLLSIAVFWFIYPLRWELGIAEVDSLLIILAMAILFHNLYTSICYFTIKKQSERYLQLLTAYHQQHEYYLSQTEVNRAIRKMAHDMKHHYDYLNAALQKSDSEKAVLYIAELMSQTNAFIPNSITGNDDVDALLNVRVDECKSKGLILNVSGFLPQAMPFSVVDINILLGNALDNAIEAACHVRSTHKQLNPRIEVSLSFSVFRFGLNVKNPYCHSLVKMDNGRFYSQKHKEAGLGTEIMNDVVKKYDGAMLTSSIDGVFELTILLNAKVDLEI